MTDCAVCGEPSDDDGEFCAPCRKRTPAQRVAYAALLLLGRVIALPIHHEGAQQ